MISQCAKMFAVMLGREGRRRLTPRQSSFRTIALLTLIPVFGLMAVLVWIFISQNVRLPAPAKKASKTKPAPVANRGKIVLIFDDVGFDHQPLSEAMRIDPNVNFSVLPNAAHAAEVANLLYDRGFEVLCHLPMEPEQFPRVSPGPGAVLTTMSDDEIARTTVANVEAVPYARGVNNHMGSRATADRRVMESVLGALPADMYFIDSRTTSASVAAAVARSMNVRAASRNVFLDDVPTDPAVRRQLYVLAREAEQHGIAIGIGHMYPATVRVLRTEAPRLRREGFRFIRASQAVR